MKTRLITIPIAAILLLTLAVGVVAAQDADKTTAPSNLVLTPGSEYLYLAWTPASDDNCNQQHYVWRWEVGDTENKHARFMMQGLTKASMRNSMFEAGKAYNFQVESLKTDDDGDQVMDENHRQVRCGVSGIVSYTFPAEEEKQPEPDPTEPDPAEKEATGPNPENLTAKQKGSDVVLAWVPGNDPQATHQDIKRREPRKGWTTIRVSADAKTYTDAKVEAGKKYIYRVESWNESKKVGVSKAAKVQVR